jgi:predicted RNA-binding Zn ribbon-like protein
MVTDYLADKSWRATFVTASGLATIPRTAFPLATFEKLRARLRAAAEQIARTGDLSRDHVRVLNETLSSIVFRAIERTPHGFRVVIKALHRDWEWVGAHIVASFGEFLESNEAHRLKICPDLGCRWVFFDETKGNTKRWCNDRRCGNRDKVRRYRAKHRHNLGE